MPAPDDPGAYITQAYFSTFAGNVLERLEKQDKVLEAQDLTLKAQDSALAKIAGTLNEVKGKLDDVAKDTSGIRTIESELKAAQPLAKRLWRYGTWLAGASIGLVISYCVATGRTPPQLLQALRDWLGR